jgi:adenosyl cobinamide kinase/adenosyl cobinamide phosphate guanylyltransferase
MPLIFLTGGARSGKSRLALELATSLTRDVTVIVTAEALDHEMASRIARHRAERPEHWAVEEEPVELEKALERTPAHGTVIVDCLTLWVSNLMAADVMDEEIERRAESAARAGAARAGWTIAVGNEVGAGIVPADPLSRRYRDLLGRVNTLWAAQATKSALVVAGRALPLEDPRDFFLL